MRGSEVAASTPRGNRKPRSAATGRTASSRTVWCSISCARAAAATVIITAIAMPTGMPGAEMMRDGRTCGC